MFHCDKGNEKGTFIMIFNILFCLKVIEKKRLIVFEAAATTLHISQCFQMPIEQ